MFAEEDAEAGSTRQGDLKFRLLRVECGRQGRDELQGFSAAWFNGDGRHFVAGNCVSSVGGPAS